MTYNKKYRFYISLDNGGVWNELFVSNEVTITWKKGNGQFFYRAESNEWKINWYKNKSVFNLLLFKLKYPPFITQKVLVKIDYYSDNVNLTKRQYLGYLPLSGFTVDNVQRVIKLKPRTYDNYSWYEEAKDIKVDLSELSRYIVYGVQPGYENTFGLNFMKLFDIMNLILGTVNGGLAFKSQLFSSDTNPVNGTPNGYKNILLQAGAYFLLDPPEDFKPEITLGEMVELFTKAFNCGWHVDGNWFVVEHYNYYRNGMTYTGTPTVGVDLTDTDVYKLKYQTIYNRDGKVIGDRWGYELDGFPKRQEFRWGIEGDEAWSYIEYTHPACDIEKNEETKISKFFTDPYWVQTFQNEPDENIFFVATADPVSPPYVGYTLKMGPSWNSVRNGYMYFKSLLHGFFTFNAYFDWRFMRIAGEFTTSGTYTMKRTMVMDELKFPHLEDFEFTDLIKVYHGLSEISQIKLNTNTGYFTANVIFDWDQTPSLNEPEPEPIPAE